MKWKNEFGAELDNCVCECDEGYYGLACEQGGGPTTATTTAPSTTETATAGPEILQGYLWVKVTVDPEAFAADPLAQSALTIAEVALQPWEAVKIFTRSGPEVAGAQREMQKGRLLADAPTGESNDDLDLVEYEIAVSAEASWRVALELEGASLESMTSKLNVNLSPIDWPVTVLESAVVPTTTTTTEAQRASQGCATRGDLGAGPGVACKFPFTSGGREYTKCTNQGARFLWRGVENETLDDDWWGQCSAACEQDGETFTCDEELKEESGTGYRGCQAHSTDGSQCLPWPQTYWHIGLRRRASATTASAAIQQSVVRLCQASGAGSRAPIISGTSRKCWAWGQGTRPT